MAVGQGAPRTRHGLQSLTGSRHQHPTKRPSPAPPSCRRAAAAALAREGSRPAATAGPTMPAGHVRAKRGSGTGPSPVDRRKTGSRHPLICDGRGTPLKVITTAANVNDVTQTLALVDSVPPVAGRPGRPRRGTQALLGDKGYDSDPNRRELRERRILPVISRRGAPNIEGLGKLRYVVEQTFALREGGGGSGGTLRAPVRYSPVSCPERSLARGSL
ncbi:transposase [Streptomyces collinus]|uniref:transposase n=1 Tax=Streptomyces collinus TaxID=42684 RepID=UPI0038047243